MTRPRLWLVPLEPMEERYTGPWYRWLPESMGTRFDVTIVRGDPLRSEVRTGAFLDLTSTFHYKATQLQRLALLFDQHLVRPGDSFLFADVQFGGVEAVRTMAQLSGVPVHLFGFLHAGSYTRGDFMAPTAEYAAHLERAWALACDRVYVGSQYHRRAFASRRGGHGPLEHTLTHRVVVTGNPWRTDEARALVGEDTGEERPIDVLFPHRPDAEKGLPEFLAGFLPGLLADGRRVCFTTGRSTYRSTNAAAAAAEVERMAAAGLVELRVGLTRSGFYATCRQAKVVVSTAVEENFGYAIVEGMAQGAMPLLPDTASYPELVDTFSGAYLYQPGNPADFHTALRRLLTHGASFADPVYLARRHDAAELRMVQDMASVVERGVW